MEFSLVTTTFNEIEGLEATIRDIDAQTILPDEIIVVDAGSTDGTLERLGQWDKDSALRIRVEVLPKCNIAEGRNRAIELAQHDLIVSTDFGCHYHPEWLRSITAPFQAADVHIVAGNFTVREEDTETLAACADYILQDAYQVQMDEYFVPSSRSIAYYKSVWEKVGRYPEWLTLAADDSNFAYLVDKYYDFVYVQQPYVYWQRHQGFKGFVKEAYRYGLGEGEAGGGLRNFFSNLVETTCRYTLFLNLLLWPFGLLPFWLHMGLLVPQLFGLRSYVRAFRRWWPLRSGKFHFGVFLAALYLTERSRIAHMRGYIQGKWLSDTSVQQEARELQKQLHG